MSRNVGVDQDVLEAFWLRQAQRAHPVAWLAAGDRQRKSDEVAVEVSDLVASLEGHRIAAAGCDDKARHGGGDRGVGHRWRVAAAQMLDLEKARVGDEPADDAPLQRGWHRRERLAVGCD